MYLLLRFSSACLCLSSSVKPSLIRTITLTCILLCLSLESPLSSGRCSLVTYLLYLLSSTFIYFVPYFSLSILYLAVKYSWIRAITFTCLVLCRSLEPLLSIGGFGCCYVPSGFAVFYLHRQVAVTNCLNT